MTCSSHSIAYLNLISSDTVCRITGVMCLGIFFFPNFCVTLEKKKMVYHQNPLHTPVWEILNWISVKVHKTRFNSTPVKLCIEGDGRLEQERVMVK